MTMRKWILLGLLVPVVGVGVAAIIWPENGWLEYGGLIFTVPVMVVNAWEWSMPKGMEMYFGKGKKERAALNVP
jgi:hypothetical protein